MNARRVQPELVSDSDTESVDQPGFGRMLCGLQVHDHAHQALDCVN